MLSPLQKYAIGVTVICFLQAGYVIGDVFSSHAQASSARVSANLLSGNVGQLSPAARDQFVNQLNTLGQQWDTAAQSFDSATQEFIGVANKIMPSTPTSSLPALSSQLDAAWSKMINAKSQEVTIGEKYTAIAKQVDPAFAATNDAYDVAREQAWMARNDIMNAHQSLIAAMQNNNTSSISQAAAECDTAIAAYRSAKEKESQKLATLRQKRATTFGEATSPSITSGLGDMLTSGGLTGVGALGDAVGGAAAGAAIGKLTGSKNTLQNAAIGAAAGAGVGIAKDAIGGLLNGGGSSAFSSALNSLPGVNASQYSPEQIARIQQCALGTPPTVGAGALSFAQASGIAVNPSGAGNQLLNSGTNAVSSLGNQITQVGRQAVNSTQAVADQGDNTTYQPAASGYSSPGCVAYSDAHASYKKALQDFGNAADEEQRDAALSRMQSAKQKADTLINSCPAALNAQGELRQAISNLNK